MSEAAPPSSEPSPEPAAGEPAAVGEAPPAEAAPAQAPVSAAPVSAAPVSAAPVSAAVTEAPPTARVEAPATPAATPPAPARRRASPGAQAVAFLASYGFACVLLLLLALLVYLGTMEQVELGLFEAQKRYFESPFLVHWLELGPLSLPLPLPGVHLLLALLAINLLLGGLVRIRKSARTAGVIVAHLGIALLLLGGLVTFWFSDDGQLTLLEGQTGGQFRAYHEWELAIYPVRTDGLAEAGREELLVRQRDLQRAPVTFSAAGLPFQLRLDGWWKNARPKRTPSELGPSVEGWSLHALPLEKEAELNYAGAYATVLAEGGERQGILWGFEHFPLRPVAPWVVEVGGQRWAIELRRRAFDLPFTIRLDEFTHEYHPGTQKPRVFMSDVTKLEDGAAQPLKISMNEPLRHRGYTLFQSGFGPRGAQPGTPMWSTFAVVRNPADHWPLYACIVISLGLLLHFLDKLIRYVRAQQARRGASS